MIDSVVRRRDALASWSLAGVVRARVVEAPQDILLRDGGLSMSAAVLDERSNRVATGLWRGGLRPGDRVGFMGRNCFEYFELLFGAAKVGCIPVGVNWRLGSEQLQYVISDAGLRMLVTRGDAASTHTPQGCSGAPLLLLTGEAGSSYQEWRDEQENVDPGYVPSRDETAVQIYTSGTTGAAKGVLLSHSAIAASLTLADRWHLKPGCVALANLPLFHFGGTVWPVQALAVGGSVVIHRDFDPARVVREARELITTAIAVPTMLMEYCDAADAQGGEFPALECLGYGSAPIREAQLLRAMRTFDCELVQTYGMTETCGVMTQLVGEDHDPEGPRRHLLRSAGRPVPGVEVRTVSDESGEALPAGDIGEVVARAPWLMLGYWNKPEQTRDVLRDGWMHTGDLGYLDQQGYLYLTDRATDMIITGGENVHPVEVENVLMRHPLVADVVAVGLPSEKWGEEVIVAVVPVAGSDVNCNELLAFARERLAHFKCPRRVVLLDELPRNETGKIRRPAVRELLATTSTGEKI